MARRRRTEHDPIERVGRNRFHDHHQSHQRVKRQLDELYGPDDAAVVPHRKRHLLTVLMGLAAAIALLVFCLPTLLSSSPDRPLLTLVEELRQPTSTEPVGVTRSAGSTNDLLEAATTAYERQEYGTAAVHWRQLYGRVTDERRLLYGYFAGNAYLLDRNPALSVGLLEDVLRQLQPTEGLFGMTAVDLALGLIDLDRTEEARSVLRRILPATRRSYEKAVRLLELL